MNHRLDQIICWFFAHFVANIGANLKIDSSVGAKKKKNTHIHGQLLIVLFPLCSSTTMAAFKEKTIILTGASGGLERQWPFNLPQIQRQNANFE